MDGMYRALGAISPQWGKLQQKYGGVPSGDATGEFGPTDEEDGMLKALSAQTIQPYRSGWGALPGVAASLVGGMAGAQLRQNAQQRQGIDNAAFGSWVKQMTGSAPQPLPSAQPAAAGTTPASDIKPPGNVPYTPPPALQSKPDQRPAITGGAGAAPPLQNDRPNIFGGGQDMTQERVNAASPGMPQPPQSMPPAAQPAVPVQQLPQQQSAPIQNRLATVIDGQLSSLEQERASLGPMLANPRTRQVAMHRLDQLEHRRFQLEQHRMTIDDPMTTAKLENLKAQTDMIRSRSNLYDSKAGGGSAPRRMGMREDGTIYEEEPRSSSQVLGASAQAPDSEEETLLDGAPDPTNPEAFQNNPTQAATVATDVPGLVVTPKGVPSQYGTQRADQNKAMSKVSPADAERYQKHMDNQRRWTQTHGRPPPSGMIYNEDGSLHNLKKDEEETRALSKTQALTDDVKNAKAVLVDGSNVLSRGAAAATGGWMFPSKEEAMRSVEHAVTQFTAMVEGKRHANAQDVRMLRFFSPAWNDSSEIIGFKLDQLHRIMNGYLGNKVPSGDVFRTELQKSVAAARSRGIKADPQPQPQSAPSAQNNTAPQANNAGPVRVNTPGDAAKLPPGTKFITPDGQIRERH